MICLGGGSIVEANWVAALAVGYCGFEGPPLFLIFVEPFIGLVFLFFVILCLHFHPFVRILAQSFLSFQYIHSL